MIGHVWAIEFPNQNAGVVNTRNFVAVVSHDMFAGFNQPAKFCDFGIERELFHNENSISNRVEVKPLLLTKPPDGAGDPLTIGHRHGEHPITTPDHADNPPIVEHKGQTRIFAAVVFIRFHN